MNLVNGRSSRIAGGGGAAPSEFPYVVPILVNGIHRCSGFIYNDLSVVTTASCVVTVTPGNPPYNFVNDWLVSFMAHLVVDAQDSDPNISSPIIGNHRRVQFKQPGRGRTRLYRHVFQAARKIQSGGPAKQFGGFGGTNLLSLTGKIIQIPMLRYRQTSNRLAGQSRLPRSRSLLKLAK